ncbi:MAG TPA: sigma 54-interacting transcriptional regulator [Kofleriaceae bacterium]|nr:sigma 54-interacting transcriptional regulator [Kofleriaceae bacterium]
MTDPHSPAVTAPLRPSLLRVIRRFSLHVVSGPSAARSWQGGSERCTVGSHPGNELVVDDPTVSRFHCELVVAGDRVRVRDLGSRNGTVLGEAWLTDATVADRATLILGNSAIRVAIEPTVTEVAQSSRTQFGPLLGSSAPMRELFSQLERIAPTDATVLIEGETGSGKEGVVCAIHGASERQDGPLIVVDCSAVPANLIESELFGHEPGAFTGATSRRIGAFEAAHGGTLFLDELGELPAELQPKLLRALESREIRRVGSHSPIKCDVRIVAATNRDLRREVNRGAFRADLYYRLAVVRVLVPPLRARPTDIPLLVEHFLRQLGARAELRAELSSPQFLAALAGAPWQGNVRELRNHVEQCLVFGEARSPGTDSLAPLEQAASSPLAPGAERDERTERNERDERDERSGGAAPAASEQAPAGLLPYEHARRAALVAFESTYLRQLLASCHDNVAHAAREAGVNRAYLHRLLRRHGLR